MPEYIVGQGNVARVTTETWLARYWLSVRTLRGEETGLNQAEAEAYLREQATGNPSAAIRRRCWLAMDDLATGGLFDDAQSSTDENKGR